MTVRKLIEDDYSLELVTDKKDELVQNLTTRLRMWKEEWFLNTSDGTDYPAIIGNRLPIRDVEAIIKTRILETENVEEITEFNIASPNYKREMLISFTVKCSDGSTQEVKSLKV